MILVCPDCHARVERTKMVSTEMNPLPLDLLNHCQISRTCPGAPNQGVSFFAVEAALIKSETNFLFCAGLCILSSSRP
jgi:hypothetical protein